MRFVYLLLILGISGLMFVVACQTDSSKSDSRPLQTGNPAIATASPSMSAPDGNSPSGGPQFAGAEFTDDLGRKVQLKGLPQRIISLSPANTEMVFALGLEDKLIGVTTYCNYPPAAEAKPKVSEYSIVDVEKVVSLQPDLILADSIHQDEVIPALEKLGMAVFEIDPPDLDGIMNDLTKIGQMGGKEKEAASLVAGLRRRIQAVTDKTDKMTAAERPRVFFLTWHDPLWTTGSGTLMSELMAKAGGTNIAADLKGHSQIDLETVIQRNPQIIIVMGSMGDQNTSFNFIKNEPRFRSTEAVKNDRVYRVEPDVYGRTTPRSVEGLEEMAGLIQPGLLK